MDLDPALTALDVYLALQIAGGAILLYRNRRLERVSKRLGHDAACLNLDKRDIPVAELLERGGVFAEIYEPHLERLNKQVAFFLEGYLETGIRRKPVTYSGLDRPGQALDSELGWAYLNSLVRGYEGTMEAIPADFSDALQNALRSGSRAGQLLRREENAKMFGKGSNNPRQLDLDAILKGRLDFVAAQAGYGNL